MFSKLLSSLSCKSLWLIVLLFGVSGKGRHPTFRGVLRCFEFVASMTQLPVIPLLKSSNQLAVRLYIKLHTPSFKALWLSSLILSFGIGLTQIQWITMANKEGFNNPHLSSRNGIFKNGAGLAPITSLREKKNGYHPFGETFILLSTDWNKPVGFGFLDPIGSLIHRGCPKWLGLVHWYFI